MGGVEHELTEKSISVLFTETICPIPILLIPFNFYPKNALFVTTRIYKQHYKISNYVWSKNSNSAKEFAKYASNANLFRKFTICSFDKNILISP